MVVAAGTQAAHPIVDLAESADDQSGREDALVSQPADDREPVDVRKHAIDDRDGMIGGSREPDAVVALAGPIDLIAARREEIDDLLRRFGIVLSMTRIRRRPPATCRVSEVDCEGSRCYDRIISRPVSQSNL